MPYIKAEERPDIDELALAMMESISTPGQLNYAISQLCWMYLQLKEVRYTTMNEIHGVLACADKEFYRRVTAPYEDEQIKKNGDVFIS